VAFQQNLSLGIEPGEFDEVVIESLVKLDHLLTQFNFSNPNNDVVKKLFNKKELPLPPEYQSDSGLTVLPPEAVATLTQVLNYAKSFSDEFYRRAMQGQTLQKISIYLSK